VQNSGETCSVVTGGAWTWLGVAWLVQRGLEATKRDTLRLVSGVRHSCSSAAFRAPYDTCCVAVPVHGQLDVIPHVTRIMRPERAVVMFNHSAHGLTFV
jgi:hypothetical protein